MEEGCVKYEEWPNGFVLMIVSLMVLWLVMGVWASSPAGVAYAGVFALLYLSVFYSAFYLTCRHCYYYGKKCYLAVGLVVPYFFMKVEGPVEMSDMEKGCFTDGGLYAGGWGSSSPGGSGGAEAVAIPRFSFNQSTRASPNRKKSRMLNAARRWSRRAKEIVPKTRGPRKAENFPQIPRRAKSFPSSPCGTSCP